MTVSAIATPTQYTGDGTNATLPTVFAYFVDSDVIVTQRVTATGVDTTMVKGTHYTISGGSSSGATGTVTVIAGATNFTSAMTWTLRRSIPLTQTLDYLENDIFPAVSHEQGLDRLTMQSQDRDAVVNRSLRFPVGDASSLTSELPNSVLRASKALTFDSSGNVVVTDMATASGTTVTATGSTTARTLAERFADSYNVLDWGAVANGSTNDAAAINLAIAAASTAGGGRVYIPAGTYAINATSGSTAILMKSNVWLQGDGVGNTKLVLDASADAHLINANTGSNAYISISDMSLDANGSNQTDDPGVGFHGIRIDDGGTDVYLFNLFIDESHHYGIGLQAGTTSFNRITIENVYIKNAGADGIDIKDPQFTTEGIFISDVVVDGWDVIDAGSSAAIDVRGVADISNVQLINCTQAAGTPAGVRFRIGASGGQHSRNSSLSNFYIDGSAAGMRGVILTGEYCTVANGVINVTGASANGIQIGGNTDNDASRNTVSGVTVNNPGNEGIKITDYSDENIVQGCRVFSAGGVGIRVEGGTHVTSNMIQNCYVNDAAGAACIQVDTLAVRTIINGNYVVGGAVGIKIASGVTKTLVAGNVYGVNTLNYVDEGTDTALNSSSETLHGAISIPGAAASATALAIPHPISFWTVSGTTTITSIAAADTLPGREVTLLFSSTAQMTDGSNLKLASNFTGGADRTIRLASNGTNWYEITRSTNTSTAYRSGVASHATNIVIAEDDSVLSITGSTAITNLSTGYAGQKITLIWATSATFDVTHENGSDGEFHIAGGTTLTGHVQLDTLSLVSDGTDWYETSRSVN